MFGSCCDGGKIVFDPKNSEINASALENSFALEINPKDSEKLTQLFNSIPDGIGGFPKANTPITEEVPPIVKEYAHPYVPPINLSKPVDPLFLPQFQTQSNTKSQLPPEQSQLLLEPDEQQMPIGGNPFLVGPPKEFSNLFKTERPYHEIVKQYPEFPIPPQRILLQDDPLKTEVHYYSEFPISPQEQAMLLQRSMELQAKLQEDLEKVSNLNNISDNPLKDDDNNFGDISQTYSNVHNSENISVSDKNDVSNDY
jgi:hypothetical protein